MNAQTQVSGSVNRQVVGFQSQEPSADLFEQRLTVVDEKVAAANELFLGNPIGQLTLTVGADSSKVVQSSGTLLTKQSVMPLSGT
ncbi:MAG: hypothetical protein ACK55I_02940, partial [bacterium]